MARAALEDSRLLAGAGEGGLGHDGPGCGAGDGGCGHLVVVVRGLKVRDDEQRRGVGQGGPQEAGCKQMIRRRQRKTTLLLGTNVEIRTRDQQDQQLT